MAKCTDPLLMDGHSPNPPSNSSSSYPDIEKSIQHIKQEWQNRRKFTEWCHNIPPDSSRASWRVKLGQFLDSTPVHVATVILLLIDLLATALDILKTLHNKSHDLNKCTALIESCHCVSHFEKTQSLEFLYWVGIAILSLLLINVGGLLVAFGASFFLHVGYVLDLVVLITALCLEIFLDAETAGLLVILTLWRIVRVAHGIFEVTDEAMESEIHRIEAQFQALEAKNAQLQQLIIEKDNRIAQLQKELETR